MYMHMLIHVYDLNSPLHVLHISSTYTYSTCSTVHVCGTCTHTL